MANDANERKPDVPHNGDMLKIENAILKLKDELKEHITAEFRILKKERCKVNEASIQKNRILLIFILAGGGLSGGAYGIFKLFTGG